MQAGREKVVTVGVVMRGVSRGTVEEHLAELDKLVDTAGGDIAGRFLVNRTAPDPSTYIGSGKAEEIRDTVSREKASLVVFDDDLSPAQTRNLEKIITGAKVMDRSGLILDIFVRGAQTREARTQVELAQLNYLLPRLTRQWSHLSRQAGGIGTRGVGETQLEIDRRLIRTRIARLKDDLRKIEQNRETQRKSRGKVFSIALVGYTNAGKSTLFNHLTASDASAADKLFATLDARVHKMRFPMPRPTVVIDTVGFIRKLPHHLVASFRSTMEEAVAADLVLHVIDGSHPQAHEQHDVGVEVLGELGIPLERVLDVYNKVDRLAEMGRLEQHSRAAISVSALTGEGIPALLEEIRRRELAGGKVVTLNLPPADAHIVARLYEEGEVLEKSMEEEAIVVTAWIPDNRLHLFDAFL